MRLDQEAIRKIMTGQDEDLASRLGKEELAQMTVDIWGNDELMARYGLTPQGDWYFDERTGKPHQPLMWMEEMTLHDLSTEIMDRLSALYPEQRPLDRLCQLIKVLPPWEACETLGIYDELETVGAYSMHD